MGIFEKAKFLSSFNKITFGPNCSGHIKLSRCLGGGIFDEAKGLSDFERILFVLNILITFCEAEFVTYFNNIIGKSLGIMVKAYVT